MSIDAEIAEMMREVVNIHQQMRPVILEVYVHFLIESSDIEEREYADPDQEIEVNLIHRHYVSQKDIEVRMKIVSHCRRTAGWVYDQCRF